MNVTVFYGGKKYNKGVFIDPKASSAKLWTGDLQLPVDRDSLVATANSALLQSANRAQFSSDHHQLFMETLDLGVSGTGKPGKQKSLPKCIEVQESLLIVNDAFKPTHLNIVIVRKDLQETKGSFTAGSHGDLTADQKLKNAFGAFGGQLAMDIATDKKLGSFMAGLTPLSGKIPPEQRLESYTELARWAYERRPFADSEKLPSAQEIIVRVKSIIEREARNQQLSDALISFDILVNGFTSANGLASSSPPPAAATGGGGGAATSNSASVPCTTTDVIPTNSPYVSTRGPSAVGNQSSSTIRHSTQWLAVNYGQLAGGGLEVQVAEDCGRGQKHKEGAWLPLLSVYDKHSTEPKADQTFLVQVGDKESLIRWKHFIKQDSVDIVDLLDSDTEE